MTDGEYKEYIKDTNDSELIMLYQEGNEDAKDLLYQKYKYIMKRLLSKYKSLLSKMRIDEQDANSECQIGFYSALLNYQDDKDTSLPTFITFCVERRIRNLIKKYNREKYDILKKTISLESPFLSMDGNLLDILSDKKAKDPLKSVMEDDNFQNIIEQIKDKLTSKEYDIFLLLNQNLSLLEIAKILNLDYKQVDNASQRIKAKIKDIFLTKNKL